MTEFVRQPKNKIHVGPHTVATVYESGFQLNNLQKRIKENSGYWDSQTCDFFYLTGQKVIGEILAILAEYDTRIGKEREPIN